MELLKNILMVKMHDFAAPSEGTPGGGKIFKRKNVQGKKESRRLNKGKEMRKTVKIGLIT